MADLSPETIDAIARGVAAIMLPVSVGVFFTAIAYSTLMMLKGSSRAKNLLVKEADTPGMPANLLFERVTDSAAKKAVDAIRKDPPKVPTLDEIRGAMPAIPPFPTLPDYGAQIRAMHSQINARLTKELEALKAAIPTASALELPKMADGTPTVAVLEGLRNGFNAIVPGFNAMQATVSEENLVKMMKQAYREMRQGETLRGEPGPDGELTPAQKAELEALRRDPDGKAQLVAAENAIDAAVGMKLLKETTGKALKKQLNAAFAAGQPIEEMLAPYRSLLDLALGGVPSAKLVGGEAAVGKRRIGA